MVDDFPIIPVLTPPEESPAVSTTDDLWSRLRASFRLPGCDSVPRATAWAHWYAGKQEYLDRVMDRAEPILYFIVDEVQNRGMPGELALLPVVESAFQPFALSHASAAGLWQFIPATGERYGLKQTWWYDGRRDIYAATHAALDYLEFLAKTFDGDYMLALAAYNSGEVRVARLRRASLSHGGSGDFEELAPRLPRETRSYVPKLIGLACVVADPNRFGVKLRPIVNEPRFKVVKVGTQIDLALAAKLADMDVQDLYQLNPAFNRWATDPAGPHRLLLPVDKVPVFKKNLASTPEEARVQWARHTIQKGETLSGIARHYGISVHALQRVNELHSASYIRAGHSLLVPRPSASDDPTLLALARRLSELQTAYGVSAPQQYKVRRGDSLWAISRRFHVSVSQLASANGIRAGNLLHIGQTLNIPGTGSQALASRGSSRPSNYTVRRGDSLWVIARRYRLDVSDLMRWNGLSNGSLLHPGQSISLLPN